MRVTRILVLVFAVVASAWFVLGIRQNAEIDRAASILTHSGRPTAAQLRDATSLLHSARLLNPDAEVNILRGRVAIEELAFPRARRILEGVVRDEPMNLEAWIWLGGASLTDKPEAQFAYSHWAQLDPIDTRHR
jgi:hypothetical protein